MTKTPPLKKSAVRGLHHLCLFTRFSLEKDDQSALIQAAKDTNERTQIEIDVLDACDWIDQLLVILDPDDATPSTTTNPEGLTYTEWLVASGVWVEGELQPLTIGPSYEAWLRGEDPTDWKANDSALMR